MTTATHTPKGTAIVLGASADIGAALCERLLGDGYMVVGLARDISRLSGLASQEGFTAIACDLASAESVNRAAARAMEIAPGWDLFVSSAGTMEPIGRFTEIDFDAWERSVIVNSTGQLRVLHALWPGRNTTRADVMLMAGGGTNNPFTNYSAYCVSKIALIKMCELLDDEEDNLNIFIIGPGFVRTRIHEETLRAGENAGAGLEKTKAFLESDGTGMDDIYGHLRWCLEQGKEVAGGRNFSTVHDPWRDGGEELAAKLRNHKDACRLRRAGP